MKPLSFFSAMALLLFSFSLHAAPRWHNRTVQEPLSIQTRYEFPLGFIQGALLIQRYPPLCKTAELAFEFGAATFASSLNEQPLVLTFKVDDLPARQALFSSALQSRQQGQFLYFQMMAIDRGSTFLAELSQGIKLTIQLDDSYQNLRFDLALDGTEQALNDAIDTCAKQAKALDERQR